MKNRAGSRLWYCLDCLVFIVYRRRRNSLLLWNLKSRRAVDCSVIKPRFLAKLGEM
jgi:hypothetical protein